MTLALPNFSNVVSIWEDLHEERPGFFRAFEVSEPNATSGFPVFGFCSPGGSHQTIRATAAEVWRHFPEARIFRNGRELLKGAAR